MRLGARRVRCVMLENRAEMPANEFEIEEAEVEGIELLHRRGPNRIVGTEHVEGLETLEVASVFDADGRFNPSLVDGTEDTIACDSVVLAVGQTADLSWLEPADGVEVTPRNTLVVDRETLATTAAGVYSGGDLAFGPRNLIDAIADGRRAAASIHRQLTGRGGAATVARRPDDAADRLGHARARSRRRTRSARGSRCRPRPTGRRIGSPEVELGFTEEEARLEAGRCLQCFLNIMLEPSLCILCGGCVDVCPEHCIRIVPTDDIDGLDAPSALERVDPPGGALHPMLAVRRPVSDRRPLARGLDRGLERADRARARWGADGDVDRAAACVRASGTGRSSIPARSSATARSAGRCCVTLARTPRAGAR